MEPEEEEGNLTTCKPLPTEGDDDDDDDILWSVGEANPAGQGHVGPEDHRGAGLA